MSYEANYETALTYLRSGLTERSLELLLKALEEVPLEEKTKYNAIYLRILALLSRIYLQKGQRSEAIRYIEEGLEIKDNHSDLLFLKSLYFWDEQRYDEMLGTLITYLVSLTSPDTNKYSYEFAGTPALQEVFNKLIPAAHKKSTVTQEIRDILKRLVEKTGNELIRQAYELLLKMDSEKEMKDDAGRKND
jgi:tetratricopeptide (TPR) repeat protein